MKLSEDQIKEIASWIHSGLDAYIHSKTGEVTFLPDKSNFDYADTEDWGEKIEEVESNRDDYLHITGMSSRDSYRVMEKFIDKVDDDTLKIRLTDAISGRGAFSRFKRLIDDSDYRQAWFDYHDTAQLAYTRDMVKWKLREEEE